MKKFQKIELKRIANTLPGDSKFLAGRNSRTYELFKVIRIAIEFIRGFRIMHFIGPTITVFGSARFKEDHPYYQKAMEVGARLAKSGFTIMTGGGPGIMEAAVRGAKSVGGKTVGCNIVLPHEQRPNAFLDTVVTFYHFFVRKVMLVKYSYAYVILPGGFGTLDEFFEAITLIQTGRAYDFPVILIGEEFWQPMIEFFKKSLEKEGTIDQKDLQMFVLTDDLDLMEKKILETTTALGIDLKSS